MPGPTKASSDEFTLKQVINYQISDDKQVTVEHLYNISNNFSQIYPQKYQIELSNGQITNVTATDEYGNILESINSNTLTLKFNRPAIGQGQSTNFRIKYKQNDLVKDKGNTKEIEIPRFVHQNTSDSVEVNIYLPTSFGKLSFSSVSNPTVNIFNHQTHVFINHKQLKDRQVLLVFGDYQLFNFDLEYTISNEDANPTRGQIAIPPDTESQRITIKSITPLPQDIEIDNDGNWIASYHLKPNSTIEARVEGQARVFARKTIPLEIDAKKYLQPQEFWPVSSPEIINMAQQLNSPSKIYQYIVANLEYDYSLIDTATRKGAIATLNNPKQSICTDFTDLFISLSRAANIPAREIEGFAYTNNPKIKPINTNSSILHAWPQYYDQNHQSWIEVDPTWEKTTQGIDYFNDLDLNHVTFVIHGLSSQNPPPPNKSAKVGFALAEEPVSKYPSSIETRDRTSTINNPNNHALHNVKLSLTGSTWTQDIKIIPPYGHYNLDLPTFIWPPKLQINIEADDYSLQTIDVINYNYYVFSGLVIATLITLLSIGGIILTIHAKNN